MVEAKQLSLLVNPVLASNVVNPVIGLENVQMRQWTLTGETTGSLPIKGTTSIKDVLIHPVKT